MLREDIVDNRLKGDVRMYDIDVIVDEILIGIWWALHDTGIYVPSRDDNCRLANRQLFVLMILFGLIRPGIIGQLIERKWSTVVWHWRVQPFPFCNGNRIGVPSLEIARVGNCPLIMERDTVSNHIVKIRCLNAPGWHNASIGVTYLFNYNTLTY